METLQKLRFILYPSAFILVFMVAAYCTFPKTVLREMAESSISNAALAFGPKNHGVPEVSISDVSLWRLSGISIKGLKISWPAKRNELPMVFQMESLKARVGIFSLLGGAKSFSGSMSLYDGTIDFSTKILKNTGLGSLTIETDRLNLGKMAFIETTLGAPMQGILKLAIDMRAKDELSKDGNGSFKLTLDQFRYGPGSLKLPSGGMVSSLTVPEMNLGKLAADLALDKGQLESKTIALSGGDVEADIKLNVALSESLRDARILGNGWFSIKPEFVNSNEALKMLYDLLPALRTAQQGDGKVGLAIRGMLLRPNFSLERFSGTIPDAKIAEPEDDDLALDEDED